MEFLFTGASKSQPTNINLDGQGIANSIAQARENAMPEYVLTWEPFQ